MEKRKDDRLSAPLRVKWKHAHSDEIGNTDVARDISVGGLCLLVSEQLHPGEALRLEFDLPQHGTVRTDGVVRRISVWTGPEAAQGKKYKAGVAFTSLAASDRERIEQLIIASYFT